jgi:hypothetical protein
MRTDKKQASSIELAALLMDAVCAPASQEEEALRQLAAQLRVDLSRTRSELMFLRAFAVDFATSMALGAGPERQAIQERCYQHWERLDREVGGGLLTDLKARLEYYTEVLDQPGREPTGLKGMMGRAFAHCCGDGPAVQELAFLGGEMFGAVFDEIAGLLQDVEIVFRPTGGWDGVPQ